MSTDDLRAHSERLRDLHNVAVEYGQLGRKAVEELIDRCVAAERQRDELQRELDAARAQVIAWRNAFAPAGEPGEVFASLHAELAALRARLDPRPFAERAREWMRARGLAVGDGAPSFIESTITTEFAAVAASERERCAKVCDERTKQWDDNAARANVHSGPSLAAAIAGGASSMDCAAAIRALPEPGKEG